MTANGLNYHGVAPPDFLDQSMRPADIVDTLVHLRFRAVDGFGKIEIDRGVRDYLLAAVRARTQPY
jgi:hypothetical protein